MKSINTALQQHISQEQTTLATCWKVTRRDNIVYGFTDHDRALIIDGVTYEASTGFTPTAIEGTDALNVDNLDVEGMLSAASMSEEDILAGHFDFAEVEVFLVNYADISQGSVALRFGWLGEVSWQDGQFIAEIRGLTQKLTHTVGTLYSPTCRAVLGDEACGVDISARTVEGTLTSVSGSTILYDDTRLEQENIFAHGVLIFTSGDNEGVSVEVKTSGNGTLTLMLPLPAQPNIGDTYRVSEGCDKRFTTCREQFGNVVNFRGEPHVPGFDRLLETASTRSR